jgi:arsenite methyltransferase
METRKADELKHIVRERYTEIGERYPGTEKNCGSSGCGCSSPGEVSMAEDYSKFEGYVADADLGLGCGLPIEFALIKKGDAVLDLGSGAGNDVFVARSITGPNGKVIGVDMTEKMIARARQNAEKLGLNNVEFRLGDIEQLPLNDATVDVVVSNCVLNLVPDKAKAFAETFRVLRPGGHFSISDIVIKGEIAKGLRTSMEMYAGCISGACKKEEYLGIVKEAGFTNITIQKEKQIIIADEIVAVYLHGDELEQYTSGEFGIYSITVYAEKPDEVKKPATPAAKSWWDPGCCN